MRNGDVGRKTALLEGRGFTKLEKKKKKKERREKKNKNTGKKKERVGLYGEVGSC